MLRPQHRTKTQAFRPRRFAFVARQADRKRTALPGSFHSSRWGGYAEIVEIAEITPRSPAPAWGRLCLGSSSFLFVGPDEAGASQTGALPSWSLRTRGSGTAAKNCPKPCPNFQHSRCSFVMSLGRPRPTPSEKLEILMNIPSSTTISLHPQRRFIGTVNLSQLSRFSSVV